MSEHLQHSLHLSNEIIITTPTLDVNKKIAGISAVARFIIDNNSNKNYLVFELGKKDNERRNAIWFIKIIKTYFKWMYWMIAKKNALIHFNIALAKPSIIRDTPLIIIAKLFRKKMIIHIHGGDYLTFKKMPMWMMLLLKLGLKGKNPKVVLSPAEDQALREKLKIKNLFILYNCVDIAEAKSYNRTYDKQEILKLLFLGRISDKKGLEYIYNALSSLKQKGIKFKFTMAGKGPEEEFYIKKFTDLLKNDFEFKGVVFGDSKTNILKENNVFLLPSFFEGLPMALLESMSFGLVPITTNVGSMKYVIINDENGILVNAYSADDIDQAIQKLYRQTDYMHRLSKNAKNHILTHFVPEDYINHLNKIYSYA
jgi:glycosyltransferase involved in cell wall biosynthesis